MNNEEHNRVVIFDTTLRDGEQSPGIALDAGEKVEIASQLARLGVDVIEAGFPVASQGDFEAVNAAASLFHIISHDEHSPVVCGLCRTALADIDRCWEAIEPATKRRIHTFIATSEVHMVKKLRMTPEQVKQEVKQAVSHARNYTDDVEFSPEDASRSDFDFMCEVLQIAVDCGATTLNIPDTVGFTTPWEWAERIAAVRDRVSGDYVLSSHCHNDLGLAVANSLAAVQAGARQIECTVNGIGERAGNAALEEFVMALRTRPEQFGGAWTGVKTQELARSSRLVSRLTGYPVQYNKAVVGRNAFAHESGIHQHGVLSERTTYEIMDPTEVGAGSSQIVLGKHSGRKAFAETLKTMGYKISGDALNQSFLRFKELADKKVQISEMDLEAIVAEEASIVNEYAYKLKKLNVSGGLGETPKASVVVKTSTEEILAEGSGDGMVEAVCNAIRAAVGFDGQLTDYVVSSVTGGVDALADVSLRVSHNEQSVHGRGLAADVVEASAKAFLDAINRLRLVADKGMNTGVRRPGSLDGL